MTVMIVGMVLVAAIVVAAILRGDLTVAAIGATADLLSGRVLAARS